MPVETGVTNEFEYLRAVPSRPVPIPTTGTSRIVLSKPAMLTGYSLRETAGAVATVEFINGNDSTGILAAVMALAASGFDTEILGDAELLCEGGIFLSVVAGSIRGSVWARFEG